MFYILFFKGCVRVGQLGTNFIINPTREQLLESPLNLVISAAENNNIGKTIHLNE